MPPTEDKFEIVEEICRLSSIKIKDVHTHLIQQPRAYIVWQLVATEKYGHLY